VHRHLLVRLARELVLHRELDEDVVRGEDLIEFSLDTLIGARSSSGVVSARPV
jgi:hypothetical protein